MKEGLIIVFRNNENSIDIDFLMEFCNQQKEICLVNNASNDNTYALLKSVVCKMLNVSVVNIKRMMDNDVALRTGERYMFHKFGKIEIEFFSSYESISRCLR